MNSIHILEGWPIDYENDIHVYVSRHRKSGGDLLEGVRPEYDVNGIE